MPRRRSVPRAQSSLAIAALLASCGRPATTEPAGASSANAAQAPPPSAVVASPQRVLDARVMAALREAAVSDASYARRTLYSWTTREQVETLRSGKTLLLATELPSGPTPYVELLQKTASERGPYADLARLLLLHPSLERRRYAWTRPWPTRIALADHDYGDQLVRVVLAPDAVIARFDPSRPDVFELHDLDERPVPIGEILAAPARLAAVLHVRTVGGTPVAHREYVLCNESAIVEWSLATPALKDAIAEDVALLDSLAAANLAPAAAASNWHTLGDADAVALYARSLAFDSERSRSTPENLRAMADAMRRAEPLGPALVVAPSARFAVDAVVPDVRIRKPAVRIARMV